MTFLIVDPDLARFKGLRRTLLSAKLAERHAVLQCLDIGEALKLTEREPIDFIFAWCGSLRDIDDNLGRLRDAVPSTPIVALTRTSLNSHRRDRVLKIVDDVISSDELSMR